MLEEDYNKAKLEERIDERQKKETEKQSRYKPWWQTVHPVFLIGGIIIIVLMLKNMQLDSDQKSQWLLIIALIIVAWLFMKKEEKMLPLVTPKEAEILVERECERKKRWKQFPLMAQYHVGPIINSMHRDSMGMYYDVAVRIDVPFERPKYYIAKVMMGGPERGFVTMIESFGPITGREKMQETVIIPRWLKDSTRFPALDQSVKGMLKR